MYKVGKPYYVGIVSYKENNQEDIDVLCLVDNEEKIEEMFNDASNKFRERFNASLISKDNMRRKFASKDKNIEIEVFFVERMLMGRRNGIQM